MVQINGKVDHADRCCMYRHSAAQHSTPVQQRHVQTCIYRCVEHVCEQMPAERWLSYVSVWEASRVHSADVKLSCRLQTVRNSYGMCAKVLQRETDRPTDRPTINTRTDSRRMDERTDDADGRLWHSNTCMQISWERSDMHFTLVVGGDAINTDPVL